MTIDKIHGIQERIERVAEKVANYPARFQPFMHQFLVTDEFVERTNPVTKDWAHRNYQQLLLAYGVLKQAPYWVPDELSYLEPERQQCYLNCFNAVFEVPGYTYVEGFAASHGLIVDHAWLEDSQGRIVDLTWANHNPLSADVTPTYFGVRFHTDFVLRRSSETGWASIFRPEWELKPDFPSLRFGFETDDAGFVTDFKEAA